MYENITSNEGLLMNILIFLVPLVILTIFYLFNRKKYKEESIHLIISKYLPYYMGGCLISLLICLMIGSSFLVNEERLQEVQEAKIETIAKELHVSKEQLQIEEKEYNVEKNKETKHVYEVKTKEQTWEVILNREAFKQYRVVKVSNVLKEEKIFDQ